MPVWFEKEEPNTIMRSDSFMNQLAMGVPLRPRTPPAKGCWSEISPLPLKVVITGAFSFSAKAMTLSLQCRAPNPITITGRLGRVDGVHSLIDRSGGGGNGLVAQTALGSRCFFARLCFEYLNFIRKDEVGDIAFHDGGFNRKIH